MSHVRLGEGSDCDASLNLKDVGREQGWEGPRLLGSFNKATEEHFTQSQPPDNPMFPRKGPP